MGDFEDIEAMKGDSSSGGSSKASNPLSALLELGGAFLTANNAKSTADANADAQFRATLEQATSLGNQAGVLRESRDSVLSEAQASDFNATIADQKSTQALQDSAEEERRFRVSSAKDIGRMQAQFGGMGSTGSALNVLSESAATAELDALTIRHAGAIKANDFGQEANLARFRSATARRSATIIGQRADLLSQQGDRVAGTAGSLASGLRQRGTGAAAASLVTSGADILRRMG